MTKDVSEMQKILITLLKKHIGALKITFNTKEKFEVCGTIEAMQGKKKVDGFYFVSVVPKPKDVRLYFFPVYTHKDELGELPQNLKRCLKGKSCFHIKQMDKDLEQNLDEMISRSIEIYKMHNLV
jgi:hypothetical protein